MKISIEKKLSLGTDNLKHYGSRFVAVCDIQIAEAAIFLSENNIMKRCRFAQRRSGR